MTTKVVVRRIPAGFSLEGEGDLADINGAELISKGFDRLPCEIFTDYKGIHWLRIQFGHIFYWMQVKV